MVVRYATSAASLACVLGGLLAACGDDGALGGIPTGVLLPDGAVVDGAGDAPTGTDGGLSDVLVSPEGSPTPDPFAGAPAYVKGTDPSPHLADTHHVGQSCGDNSCHAPGACGGVPCFFAGGTVYTDYKGTTPAVGVEIRAVDMQGHAASAYSGTNGNFKILIDAGLTFPAIVGVRDGTTMRPMVTVLGSGMCGTAACHVPGGSPSQGDMYPVHVP